MLVPVELNVKYANEIHPNLLVDAGGGISYSYAPLREEMWFSPDREEDGWLFGGQVFGDLMYKFNCFTFGINAKYQITEELDEVGFGFSTRLKYSAEFRENYEAHGVMGELRYEF